MNYPTTFNAAKTLEEIRKKETQIYELEEQLHSVNFELQELKRINATYITISWKESIKKCLEVESDQKAFFLKTPMFISDCVAWTHGVALTRDIKNKIATTLSVMFNQGLIGRLPHNGKTYYGILKYFKSDLTTLKKEYADWVELLP